MRLARSSVFRILFVAVCYAAGAFGASVASAADEVKANALKVCTDPDNLPYSKSEGTVHGLFVDLAEKIGKQIGVKIEYDWWLSYNQRKTLRLTILDKSCDVYFALPADPEYHVRGLQRTTAFINVSYALVSTPSFNFTKLTDLKGKRIAVLYGSPPHILLSRKDEGYNTVSFLEQDEALAALSKGDVDAALLWGPSVGYENLKMQNNRWRVTPVSGEGFGGALAIAVRAPNDALLAKINNALTVLAPDIQQLSLEYGFPQQKPVLLSKKLNRDTGAVFAKVKTGKTNVAYSNQTVNKGFQGGFIKVSDPVATAISDDAKVQAGHVQFNNTCSHCHGSDAVTFVSPRDLRKLHMRYQDKWQEMAVTTIQNGRSDAGMPTWKDILTADQIDKILAFLSTIQK